MTAADHPTSDTDIAIVGLAGRFPGAPDVDTFWRNVRDGVESVTPFDDETLRARGVSAESLADPAYVKSGIVLDGMDQFDAGFFGYTPREASLLDPQHRLFLETAWEALEHAGHTRTSAKGPVGVYAGSGANVYLLRHLLPSAGLEGNPDLSSLLGLLNGNDKDSLSTRVAYKLDLRGPAVSVQTACSTSLVAVHLACRSLLNHETDLALAGGVWLNLLQRGGYRHQPGSILSPDGHCRAFDARAAGTAIGSGVGLVALKRLADALADGDTVHAVIKGSALNNDGAAKVGYTAPSVDGQAEVIRAALAMADVSAASIGYVEAHGTGTTLGDPIEVAALTQAFRADTARRGFCALGSAKTNVGHLDAAAGVTGLIRAAMALRHATLPPSLNFEHPNPAIDFEGSPFRVLSQAAPWPAGDTPRRAGVSAFGMGGTNVHVVLEEAPPAPARAVPAPSTRVLRLSARSEAALASATERLAGHLGRHPEQPLGDVAHTLRTGRVAFGHRAAVVASGPADAIGALPLAHRGVVLSDAPTVAFLFPGQGAQHPGMLHALYRTEPVVRDVVDRCSVRLLPRLGVDLRTVMFGDDPVPLARTALTQPALFVAEYALAQLWASWGLRPEALMGHSIGEYTAACLAGVFSLDDTLVLVAERGRLLQSMAPGAMLAVGLAEADVQGWLGRGCDLAAVNAADLCVLAGPDETLAPVERDLAARGVMVRRLVVSHAFHSASADPVLDAFHGLVGRLDRSAPTIPIVSNVTGGWLSADDARDPAYWVRHLRGTVRFADGLSTLLARPDRALLEVGPGETLARLARRHPSAGPSRPVLSSQLQPDRIEPQADQPARCVARLWVAGVDVPGHGLDPSARRVPLPTYPFERQSYWVEAGATSAAEPPRPAFDGWFHVPAWQRTAPVAAAPAAAAPGCCLAFTDPEGLGAEVLRVRGGRTVRIEAGPRFARLGDGHYRVRPGERDDLDQVFLDLGETVTEVLHLWSLDPASGPRSRTDTLARGFFSLVALAQSLEAGGRTEPLTVTVVADGLDDVTGDERLDPLKATLSGPCKVMPQESPWLRVRRIDVTVPAPDRTGALARLAAQVVAELASGAIEPAVALRGPHRWVCSWAVPPLAAPAAARLRPRGVYAITGGLGGVGLALAGHLARHWQARLVLIGRKAPADPAAVRSLEALGAEVLVLQADVADAARLRGALAAARTRFGELNGVVHAAGTAGGGLMADHTPARTAAAWDAKVSGTEALMAALDGAHLDFVVLCSSLASLAGGMGKVDYVAANAFLDATAEACGRTAPWPVLSILWDGWRGIGMAAGMRLPEHVGLDVESGGRAFERIVNGPARARTAVSTVDLAARLAATGEDLLDQVEADRPAVAAGARHPRPALQTAFAAPDGDLEEGLCDLWGELLGLAPIGVADNLFELGGDSLLAIQMLARVRSRFGVELHPAAFFKAPTVTSLAVLVETRLIEDIERGEAALLPA